MPEGDGATAAVLRRGYLTADTSFENGWFGRLRVEVNQSGDFETCEFEADFKDAYVGHQFERHTVTLGLQPSLTFDFIESFWTMRYLMRTPGKLAKVVITPNSIVISYDRDDQGLRPNTDVYLRLTVFANFE